MKTIYFYLALCGLTFAMSSCGKKMTEEEAKNAVINGERERLDYMLQGMPDVKSIVIDSMRIHVKDEPMNGFLYTTWKYSVKTSFYPEKSEIREKSIIIAVDSIRQSRSHEGYIEWKSDWDEAYRAIRDDILNIINEIRREELEKFHLH